jgi:tagatose-1,6-bisphosphate aldolase non-catalytic subunit AgaZ/GatZ
MIKHKLDFYLNQKRCTILGVGPMSKLCVDVTIELANQYNIPIMLIASRRQIDAEKFGGGYVNNWSTEEFAHYVIDNDYRGQTILARDHGGPWQSDFEKENQLSYRKAMESAKQSYEVDIISGFEILHIDASVDIFDPPDIDDVLYRVYELLDYCYEVARRENRNVLFEIGTEEQSGLTNTIENYEYILSEVTKYCSKSKIPFPTFFVVQTGTKVMETRNVGTFDSPFRIAYEIPAEIQIPKIIELCSRYHIFMKEHNTDYLSNSALSWHPKFGIHAANVAPEFGVTETRAFLELLESNNLGKLAENFLEIAYSSNKWRKWMTENSKATDRDKAIIAGHYVFSTTEFALLKEQAQKEFVSKDIEVDVFLKEKIKNSIMRYLRCFRMVDNI